MSNPETKLTATVIRYLLAINELDSSASGVKSIDIAKLLRVTKPSVHTMIKKLCEKGYATHAKYEAVHLTALGKQLAERYAQQYAMQEGADTLTNKGCDITFDHVGFAYNGEETVLKDVNFTAKQGEVTALIGPSGGGKTTVSRLATRFWDVTKGTITVGGMDVSKIDPETLMGLYSIVFQDVTLFNNSVMENIRVGKKEATDEEVMAAARMANCDEFVSKLPQGYDTQIGENGSELSGGERQRLSIARAFLKDAPIILLDEATASLDVDNETKIQGALSKLIEGKTVLLIAHRMRTVSGTDKIVVLENGEVSECGTPDTLYHQNGTYRRMVELQMAAQ